MIARYVACYHHLPFERRATQFRTANHAYYVKVTLFGSRCLWHLQNRSLHSFMLRQSWAVFSLAVGFRLRRSTVMTVGLHGLNTSRRSSSSRKVFRAPWLDIRASRPFGTFGCFVRFLYQWCCSWWRDSDPVDQRHVASLSCAFLEKVWNIPHSGVRKLSEILVGWVSDHL